MRSPLADRQALQRHLHRLQPPEREDGLAADGSAARHQPHRHCRVRPRSRAWRPRSTWSMPSRAVRFTSASRTSTSRSTGRETSSSGARTSWARPGKGQEYFLKHLMGAQDGIVGEELSADEEDLKPELVKWRKAPIGKLDLLVNLDFRISTTGLYADIVLPAATFYEKNDINTTDMHSFIHPFREGRLVPLGGQERLGDLRATVQAHLADGRCLSRALLRGERRPAHAARS